MPTISISFDSKVFLSFSLGGLLFIIFLFIFSPILVMLGVIFLTLYLIISYKEHTLTLEVS